ncbi:MAG: DUF4330 domain-containing protein [Candidatus Gastranaerophilales bacterium]|nr:DUF4330 domain-containing protein [Candidatus Gastranaerophilales bacterium]
MRKFGLVDLIIVAGVLIALVVGVCTAKHFRQTADKQIEATSPITFQVFLRGVTVTGEEFPVKADDKTFITIRNVPYTELSVVDVKSEPRQTFAPMAKNVLVPDPAQPSIFDAVITITDTAKITKDGAVVGGNKIKMGLPVTLEGEKYKFNGTISDVRVTSDNTVEDAGENNQVG